MSNSSVFRAPISSCHMVCSPKMPFLIYRWDNDQSIYICRDVGWALQRTSKGNKLCRIPVQVILKWYFHRRLLLLFPINLSQIIVYSLYHAQKSSKNQNNVKCCVKKVLFSLYLHQHTVYWLLSTMEMTPDPCLQFLVSEILGPTTTMSDVGQYRTCSKALRLLLYVLLVLKFPMYCLHILSFQYFPKSLNHITIRVGVEIN